jgi:dsRNA-specific ribonuclease
MFLRPLLDEMRIAISEEALADAIRPICGAAFDAKALAIISAVTGRLIEDRKANLRRRAQAEDRMAQRAAHDRAIEMALVRMLALLERIDASLRK